MDIQQRKCNTCREEKPATKEFFYANLHAKGGIEYRCKVCDNKKSELRKLKKMAVLKQGACVDCGREYHPCQMSFDHLPGLPKYKDINEMRSASMSRLQAEIKNCDLVCLNCHALRTWTRQRTVTAKDPDSQTTGRVDRIGQMIGQSNT